jgi:hypothetical protein
MSFIVTAEYEGKMDDRREDRIHAVFERCGVDCTLRVSHPPVPIDDGVSDVDHSGELQIGFSDVEWCENQNGDGTGTELTIHIGEHERATRLASELRACGLRVGITTEEVESVEA